MQTIDINCDMGESTALWPYHIEADIALFPYISSANIACGFHGGDPCTMHELVDAALLAGVAIGAHPGFEDKQNFGRTNMNLSPVKIYDCIIYQLGALDAFLQIHGTKLHHVKPHGALYNMAAKEAAMAMAVCKAVKDYDTGLILYGLSGSELILAANALELKHCSEVFADRTYQEDGNLTPRSAANAMIISEDESLQQVLQVAVSGTVTATSGKTIAVKAETVCIHTDGAHALVFAKNIHQTLNQQGIAIKPV
ncbi:MAG: 5-oxoprolinase subunit PxpA [Chitinophagaceae bacterium]